MLEILTGRRAIALSIAVLATACFLLVPATAHAQAVGATDVDITLPDIIVLHYFSNIDLTFSAATVTAWLGATSDQGTMTGASFTSDIDISSDGDFGTTGDPTAAALTLSNAWAVRAISGGAGTQTKVTIAVTDSTLTHAGGGGETIEISAGEVQDSGGGGFAGSVTFSPPGLANPEIGDVRLTLDLTNATEAGEYADGVYTLTAENI